MSDKETFKQELDARTAEIEQLIGTYLPEETGHQKTIFEAMNYSMKAGGKRLRPMLMQEMCRLFTGTLLEAVIPFMAAVEPLRQALTRTNCPGLGGLWGFLPIRPACTA